MPLALRNAMTPVTKFGLVRGGGREPRYHRVFGPCRGFQTAQRHRRSQETSPQPSGKSSLCNLSRLLFSLGGSASGGRFSQLLFAQEPPPNYIPVTLSLSPRGPQEPASSSLAGHDEVVCGSTLRSGHLLLLPRVSTRIGGCRSGHSAGVMILRGLDPQAHDARNDQM